MPTIQVWNIQDQKPVKLNRGTIALEKELENWIEHDPSLISPDLLIVGNQVRVEAGKLDLLALDRRGNYWAIIEVKRGNVRRETISQAVDYAACIHELSDSNLKSIVEEYLQIKGSTLRRFLKENDLDGSIFDQSNRNLVIYVAGTGRDPNLERMASFLRNSGIQVNVATFDTFEDGSGNWTLVRQVEEIEPQLPANKTPNPPTADKPSAEIKKILTLADKNGIGEAFRIVYEVATKHGLYPRLYSRSIMYAPEDDKRRCLIYAPVIARGGEYFFSCVPEAFAEFFNVSTIRAVSVLGVTGYWKATPENARKFAKKLERLFEIIDSNTKD